jgi:hypothetical protein
VDPDGYLLVDKKKISDKEKLSHYHGIIRYIFMTTAIIGKERDLEHLDDITESGRILSG